ncbi:hypothetical protein IHE45_13G068700 [Dioscorea alata]|uniref:Uncharacterized protein n=1 Tax=Dioscorea alata TaxID=55571 RepID=A0ACB7UYV0_DIOAL|nr:hypothetical protein IHE45_13G068700 [Dioscorea alata]
MRTLMNTRLVEVNERSLSFLCFCLHKLEIIPCSNQLIKLFMEKKVSHFKKEFSMRSRCVKLFDSDNNNLLTKPS